MKDVKLIQEPSAHIIFSLGIGKFEVLSQDSLGASAEQLDRTFLLVSADLDRLTLNLRQSSQ